MFKALHELQLFTFYLSIKTISKVAYGSLKWPILVVKSSYVADASTHLFAFYPWIAEELWLEKLRPITTYLLAEGRSCSGSFFDSSATPSIRIEQSSIVGL